MRSDTTADTETKDKEEMKSEEFRCDDEEIKTDGYYTKYSYSEEKKNNYSPY